MAEAAHIVVDTDSTEDIVVYLFTIVLQHVGIFDSNYFALLYL